MTLPRILCIVLLALCLSGCGKRRIAIDRETRRTIDTLAAREIYALRPALDSVCQLKMDSLVTVMRDSILLERRRDIQKLIGK